jgi:hypothetical protein
MHSPLAWWFWWLNVIVCVGSILYWTPKRLPDGTPALYTAGQVFIWQLIAAITVLALGASPWHLIWLAPVSGALAIITGRFLYNMRKRGLIKEQETMGTDRSEAVHLELQKRGKTEASFEAAALLDSDASRIALYEFLGQYPGLAAKFHDYWPYLTRSNMRPSRWQVSITFNQIGIKLAEEGDFHAAEACLLCSSLFVKDSPLRWAAGAGVYCAWQDRIAGKWAAKVIEFQITDKTSTDVRLQLSGVQGQRLLNAEYKRMREIIGICNEHDEWRDSYPLIKEAEEAYFVPNF